MYYVYILKSLGDQSFYVGYTQNLKKRIGEHNAGYSQYTRSKLPFTLIWYCGFLTKLQAFHFERYLKHGSGRAFMTKRLISK